MHFHYKIGFSLLDSKAVQSTCGKLLLLQILIQTTCGKLTPNLKDYRDLIKM